MNMKFITSRAHGIIDYIGGLFLIFLPFVLLPENTPTIAWTIPAFLGALIVGMAIFTNFELGVFHKIGLAYHLMMDNGLGVILAVSPWIFGFYEITYGFHLVAGILIFTSAMFTTTLTTTSQHDTKEPGEITRNYLDKK
jgi:hypothetical protein